jgi:hypothetical protein
MRQYPEGPLVATSRWSVCLENVAFVDVGCGHREGNHRARQIDDHVAAQALERLLLDRAIAPSRLVPEDPASIAPAGATDRNGKPSRR